MSGALVGVGVALGVSVQVKARNNICVGKPSCGTLRNRLQILGITPDLLPCEHLAAVQASILTTDSRGYNELMEQVLDFLQSA